MPTCSAGRSPRSPAAFSLRYPFLSSLCSPCSDLSALCVKSFSFSLGRYFIASPSSRLNHPHHRLHHPLKLRRFHLQLFPSSRSQLVIPRPPILRSYPPLRFNPALDQHPLQGRIKRSFFDLQHIFRDPLNRPSNLVPMHLPAPRQSPQDQQKQSPRQKLIPIHPAISPRQSGLCHSLPMPNTIACLCQATGISGATDTLYGRSIAAPQTPRRIRRSSLASPPDSWPPKTHLFSEGRRNVFREHIGLVTKQVM
jgi:hypothetical protein